MINEQNFQEYLLLYLDNELSVKEILEVEDYIKRNDFAKAEYLSLKATKLPSGTIRFENISSLTKNENETINQENFQEKFLLYVDGELSKNENKAVEIFVLQHPNRQAEFDAIKKSRLHPEPILHPNKKELFRKEKKLFFYIKKFAVAAVFFGITSILLLNFYYKNKQPNNTIVKTSIDKSLIVQNEQEYQVQEKKYNESIKKNEEQAGLVNNNKTKIATVTNKSNLLLTKNILTNRENNITANKITVDNKITNNDFVEIEKSTVASKVDNTFFDRNTKQVAPLDISLISNRNITETKDDDLSTTKAALISTAVVYKTLEDDDNDDQLNHKKSRKPFVKNILSKASKLINIETDTEKPKQFFTLTLR
jgi:hypothetical protein